MKNNKRYLLAVVLGIVIGGAVYVASPAKKLPLKPPQQVPVPEVLSCVKKIKVINRRIEGAETTNAQVMVEVENTSELGIVAISLESRKGKDAYLVRPNTFEADETKILIGPHERYTLSIELANIFANTALQIGSVVYSDGSEDGCDKSIKATRESKADHEQKKGERKSLPK